ncbi:MAG: MipA/OmpV family protein [Photobacterium halotolerans]
MNKEIIIGTLVCLSFLSENVSASQWSLGISASYSPVAYKETGANEVIIPFVGFEDEHLFFRGFSAGYRMFPIGYPQNVVFRIAYDPRSLKPEDSRNSDIQKLDERKAAILGGVSYQLISLLGIVEFSIGSDISHTHDGIYSEVVWRLPIRQQGWAIIPSIGYTYNGEKINNHLYGVSRAESARTNFDEFDAGWDGQFFAGLSGYKYLTKNIRLTGSVRYTNLEGNLEKSPIIDSGVNTSAILGISYEF